MATERLSMRSIREVLRQKWVLKKSHREVAHSLGISAGAVGGLSHSLRAQSGEAQRPRNSLVLWAFLGGACRDRTGDLRNAIAALSQLS